MIQQIFLDFFVKHNLSWIVKDNAKTRIRQVLNTIQASTLDNALFLDLNMSQGLKVTAPLGKSDHIGLLSTVNIANDNEYILHNPREKKLVKIQ